MTPRILGLFGQRIGRRAIWRDRSGSSAILVGLLGVVLFGFTAIGIDGANVFLAKRRQQAATDIAAMAAASALDQASSRSAGIMAANGFGTASLEIATGTYTPDAALAPAQRFALSASGNAVRVAATTTQPFIFGGAFRALLGASSGPSGFAIRTQAVARKQDTAAFVLGTGIVSLDGGLLNAMLGGLLGAQLSLGLVDYQALASANVDLFDFGDVLATRVGLSGATYGTLAASTVAQSALFASLADALGSTPAGVAARMVAMALPATATIPLEPLIDFGPSGSLAVGAPHPVSARISALDLLTALVRLCNGGHVAALDLGAALPGLAASQVLVAVGEPVQGSGYFAVGPEGTILHTAQVRILLTSQVGGAGLPATMTLPLYLEVAPATATITRIACGSGASQAQVTLAAAAGLATAAIGTVTANAMATMSASPPITAAPVLDLSGVLRVTAAAQVSLSGSGSTAIPFSAADILSGTRKGTTSTPALAALLASLSAGTRVTVSLFGSALPQPALPAAVQAAIATAAAPLDQALERLLPLLGLTVGNATMGVTGVRCGQGQLVN